MRKTMIVLLAAALVAGAILVTGCGSTKVAVDKENGEVEISTPEGNAKVSTKQPTESQIGIPIYPGAKMDENSSLSVSGETGSGTGSIDVAVLWTPDSPDKVIAWYKDALAGKPEFQVQLATDSEALMTFKDGNKVKLVTIGRDTVTHPGMTTIGISSGSGL